MIASTIRKISTERERLLSFLGAHRFTWEVRVFAIPAVPRIIRMYAPRVAAKLREPLFDEVQ